MIVSNISTPLLGLVDTAVIGHLESAQYLAAVALGGIVFNFIYWGFGFLRMSTTGLCAQALGSEQATEIKAVLFRALCLASIIAGLLLLLQKPLAELAFTVLQINPELKPLAYEYFYIRIWSAPATLSLYVLTGWFLGLQNVKGPLIIVLTTNLSNIGLDLLLVNVLDLKISGVALASVAAEYLGLVTGLALMRRYKRRLRAQVAWPQFADMQKIAALLTVNSHIFIRTWSLIFAFAFFTAQGAQLGNVIVAANAVLLNFQTFMAYALDGFAHAAEALVGRAVGEKNTALLHRSVKTAALWSAAIAVGFALCYALLGPAIIHTLTDLDSVRTTAARYLPWIIAMPVVAFTCYLFDGVFIGAMLTKQMRDAMLFALLACYLPAWYLTRGWLNDGLWFSMTVFMLARGLSMSVLYAVTVRRGQVIAGT